MPNILITLRTLHGIDTDIPFSLDRIVATNIKHDEMQTFWNETEVTFHINKCYS